MDPHLPWVTLTSTTVVIPMPASTAIRGGATRPDSGHGWALESHRPPGPGVRAGWREDRLADLGAHPGSRGQGLPRPLAELPGRQPACLEVLAQVRQDRVAVGIGSPHFSRKIILRHGVHWAPAFLSRAVVRGLGVYLMSCAQALAAGATTVITSGAPQSNHARLTAAAAARLGLRSVLVLQGEEPEVPAGNLVLDLLAGARLVWTGPATADQTRREVQRQAEKVRQDGGIPHVIPHGGSNSYAAQGYVDCSGELLALGRFHGWPRNVRYGRLSGADSPR